MTFFNLSTTIRSLLVGTATGLIAFAAAADEAGKQEYMNACASCHGADGAGSGPVAEFMTIVVPPLTGLSKANGGTFPMADVVAMIDGRTEVRGHGSGMPVWGAVFADPTAAEVKGESVDYITRGRILSLALYLESIQKN